MFRRIWYKGSLVFRAGIDAPFTSPDRCSRSQLTVFAFTFTCAMSVSAGATHSVRFQKHLRNVDFLKILRFHERLQCVLITSTPNECILTIPSIFPFHIISCFWNHWLKCLLILVWSCAATPAAVTAQVQQPCPAQKTASHTLPHPTRASFHTASSLRLSEGWILRSSLVLSTLT